MNSVGALWDGHRAVSLEQRDVSSPAPYELRVQVGACGLCGTDLHIADGEFPAAKPGVVLGHEFAGMVEEVGNGVTAFAVGDRVVIDPNIPCRMCRYCRDGRTHLCQSPEAIGVSLDGGLSEYTVVPAAQAYKVPDELPFEAAALTEPLACSLHALDRAELRTGQTVLVIGAGPIGLLCAELALTSGASRMLVSEPNPVRRERAAELGAEAVEPAEVRSGAADVVLECVGRPQTLRAAVDAASPGGRIVWVGVAAPGDEVPINPYEVFRKELSILGTYTQLNAMERSLDMLAAGRVGWRSIITHRFPLERFDEAWSVHREGSGLKVSLQPEGGTR